MSNLKTELEHLKKHVNYPADRQQVIAACNNMMDVDSEDRTWFTSALPDGNYSSADDVVKALLTKV